jgi:flagellar basal body-associated protein FliL
MSENTNTEGMSNSTKTIITIILLLLFPLAGIIMMFVWKLWPVWVRVLITVFYTLLLIGSIVLIIAGAALIGSIESDNAKLVSSSSSSSTAIANTEFKVGETIEADDKQLTVLKVEDYISTNQFSQPKSGKKFIKVTVSLANKGSSNFSFTTYNFKVQDSNGLQIDPDSTTYSLDDTLESGSLAPSGKVEGAITFEVPTTDKNLALIFDLSYTSDRAIKIKLY